MIEEILSKLPKKLQIEIIENVTQKELTESEKAKIQRLLKKEFSKHTQQGRRTDLHTSSKDLEKVPHGVIEKVAKILNESHETVRQRQYVFERIAKKPKNHSGLKKRLDSGKTSLVYAYQMLKREEDEKRPSPPLPKGQYDLIYLDPPWDYDLKLQGSPPYKTMTTDELCEMKIPAAKDCIMFIWATNPKLEDALKVIKAHNFKYKSKFTWVKMKKGKLQMTTGYYNRGADEMLLIAVKGNSGVPIEKNRPPSVVFAERTTHSKKPPIFRKIINSMYPAKKKKLEMFARKRDQYHDSTWSYWGDEVEHDGEEEHQQS